MATNSMKKKYRRCSGTEKKYIQSENQTITEWPHDRVGTADIIYTARRPRHNLAGKPWNTEALERCICTMERQSKAHCAPPSLPKGQQQQQQQER